MSKNSQTRCIVKGSFLLVHRILNFSNPSCVATCRPFEILAGFRNSVHNSKNRFKWWGPVFERVPVNGRWSWTVGSRSNGPEGLGLRQPQNGRAMARRWSTAYRKKVRQGSTVTRGLTEGSFGISSSRRTRTASPPGLPWLVSMTASPRCPAPTAPRRNP